MEGEVYSSSHLKVWVILTPIRKTGTKHEVCELIILYQDQKDDEQNDLWRIA